MLRLVTAAIMMIPLLGFNMLFDKQLRKDVWEHATAMNFVKMTIMGFFNNAVPFLLVGIATVYVNTGT